MKQNEGRKLLEMRQAWKEPGKDGEGEIGLDDKSPHSNNENLPLVSGVQSAKEVSREISPYGGTRYGDSEPSV